MLAAGAFTASLSLSSAAAGSPSLNNAAHPKVSTLSPQYLFETPVSEGTGSLYGTVFDPNGAAIPGAVATLINSESHQIVSAISDGEGAYRFSAVAVGIYSLKVAASGFEPNQVSMIKLNANDNNRLDQTLSVASINEVVEITAPSISVSGAMVVIPCSMGGLARIAHGMSEVLIGRAADVMLKERRKLILVARETPLSAIHLENMLAVTRAGAVVLPAMPSFYGRPASVEDLLDTVIGRVFDQLGLSIQRGPRWGGAK